MKNFEAPSPNEEESVDIDMDEMEDDSVDVSFDEESDVLPQKSVEQLKREGKTDKGAEGLQVHEGGAYEDERGVFIGGEPGIPIVFESEERSKDPRLEMGNTLMDLVLADESFSRTLESYPAVKTEISEFIAGEIGKAKTKSEIMGAGEDAMLRRKEILAEARKLASEALRKADDEEQQQRFRNAA